MQSESAGAVTTLVARSRFLTMLPSYVVRDRLKSGQLAILPFPLKMPPRQIGMITAGMPNPTPAVAALMAELRTTLGQPEISQP